MALEHAEKIELMRMITVYLANQDRIDYTLDKLTKNEAKLALLNSDKKLKIAYPLKDIPEMNKDLCIKWEEFLNKK